MGLCGRFGIYMQFFIVILGVVITRSAVHTTAAL